MTKQSEIELTNLSDDVIKLHDNRELMRLASLVGTDAKTPELKLAKYVAALIDTACVEARIDEATKICDDLKDNTYIYWGDGSPSDLKGYLKHRIKQLKTNQEKSIDNE